MRLPFMIAILSALLPCSGADLFVDPENGDDKNDGLPNTIWRGGGNSYQLSSLRVARTHFRPETFSEFQKLTGSEDTSVWSPDETIPDGIGADIQSLENLKSQ